MLIGRVMPSSDLSYYDIEIKNNYNTTNFCCEATYYMDKKYNIPCTYLTEYKNSSTYIYINLSVDDHQAWTEDPYSISYYSFIINDTVVVPDSFHFNYGAKSGIIKSNNHIVCNSYIRNTTLGIINQVNDLVNVSYVVFNDKNYSSSNIKIIRYGYLNWWIYNNNLTGQINVHAYIPDEIFGAYGNFTLSKYNQQYLGGFNPSYTGNKEYTEIPKINSYTKEFN